ncbi:MAG: alpha-hydroxy-acid oxidizing protein [Acidimicrobiales bacterium]|nr:alpha-hydroxy-acid oxidizing protein [Acidimicrobiales bacterium]
MWDTIRSVVRFKPVETDPVARRLAKAANVHDLRRMAKRRLPGGVFDYIDGGAEDEVTLERNSLAFAELEWVPRVLRNVQAIDPATTLLGRRHPMPLVLAPTGFTRIADSQGELAVARAAERAGLTYSLSTMGTRSIEEVAEVSDGPKWFQVYVWKDRGLVAELLGRAKAAGFEAIIITVDLAVLGRRERDVRRGFELPPKIGPSTIIDGIVHPGWTWDFVRADPITFSSVVGQHDIDGSTAVSLADHAHQQFDQSLSWADIAWFRQQWDGPIVIKGVQSVADAEIAVEHGIEAVALSNHGGRQLDQAPVPLELLDPVLQAVGGETEVIVDGGIRRGSDIVKAMCLGASACMAGRAYLYGLGAAGERGVDHVLGLLRADMERAMALVGATTIDDLSPDLVRWRSG